MNFLRVSDCSLQGQSPYRPSHIVSAESFNTLITAIGMRSEKNLPSGAANGLVN